MVAKLSVVTSETPASLPTPETIKEAVDRSERTLLVTMRATVAATIDASPPAHTLAPLMRQLREIDKEIRAIDARAKDEGAEGGAEVEDSAFDASAV